MAQYECKNQLEVSQNFVKLIKVDNNDHTE